MSFEDRARLIDEALAVVAPEHKRGKIIGEAIRNAGTLTLPADRQGLLAFGKGPLFRAAKEELGEEAANKLVGILRKKLSTAPTSTLPYGEEEAADIQAQLKARLEAKAQQEADDGTGTLPYGATRPGEEASLELEIDPLTVALVEPDSGFRAALSELLVARGHTVHPAKTASQVAQLATKHPLDAVIANLEPGGYSFASNLRIELGREMPPVMLLGGSLTLHAPRPGVTLAMPRTIDKGVAEQLERMIDEHAED